MDDDGFSNNLIYRELIGEENRERMAAIAQQRRQVAGMVWMLAAVGIIVALWVRTAVSLMDMKGKEPVCTWLAACRWQSENICSDPAASSGGEEINDALDLSVLAHTVDLSKGSSRILKHKKTPSLDYVISVYDREGVFGLS